MVGKTNPKVQDALKLIDAGEKPYAAAKKTGAVQASVYAAVKRRSQGVKVPAARQGAGNDPEATLRAMALAGDVEEVGLIVGRLFLLLEELRRKA